MPVEDRLVTLLQNGDREDAIALAKEVLKNDVVKDVDLTQDAVELTTRHFSGRHEITGWRDDEVVVEKRGEYSLTDHPALSFTTFGIYDNVMDAIKDADHDTPRDTHADTTSTNADTGEQRTGNARGNGDVETDVRTIDRTA